MNQLNLVGYDSNRDKLEVVTIGIVTHKTKLDGLLGKPEE